MTKTMYTWLANEIESQEAKWFSRGPCPFMAAQLQNTIATVCMYMCTHTMFIYQGSSAVHIITPHACARGKAIVLFYDYNKCL